MGLIITKISPKLKEWRMLINPTPVTDIYLYNYISENGGLIKAPDKSYQEVNNEEFMDYILKKIQHNNNNLKEKIDDLDEECNNLRVKNRLLQKQLDSIKQHHETISELAKLLEEKL